MGISTTHHEVLLEFTKQGTMMARPSGT